jgi:4-hydroxyphenylacetate 3-monooxygenase
MLRTGADYLDSLDDGRRVLIGKDLVTDVTAHPAFRNTARSFARIYDLKRSPENVEAMSFEEGGERHSAWYILPRTKEDLRKRSEAHRRVAQWSHGLLGRSPDHVSTFVSGMRMMPEMFEEGRRGFGDNLVRYYEHMRDNDIFACYLVITPQGARDPEIYKRQATGTAALKVVAEDDKGIYLSGVKMLGTSAVFSDEAWIGNILPLAPEQKALSVTCAVKMNAPGLQIWVRKSYEQNAANRIDSYFSSQFDETDAVLVMERTFVPWERVFVMDNAQLSRDIYFKTPAHIMGNHQSMMRFSEKLKLVTAIAHKAAELSGVGHMLPVQQNLGRLMAGEAGLLGMIAGQVEQPETLANGYCHVNRRFLYAALHWTSNTWAEIAEKVREMLSAGPFQVPADASVFEDAELARIYETNWEALGADARNRYKFIRMAWDLLGSEYAGRHTQYERFYGGPPFLNDMYNYTWAPWGERRALVEAILADMELPSPRAKAAE